MCLVLQVFRPRLVDEWRIHVDLDRGDLGRKNAAVAEELTQPDRYVGSREKRLQRLDGNAVQRRIGHLPDVRIGVFEQQDENLELLVRARRQHALRRQQPDVTRHFAAPEKVENRGRFTHWVAT